MNKRRVPHPSSTCLSVFLKAPEPGRVKTRLAARIGARPAADLYRAFVQDTLDWTSRFPAGRRRLEFSPKNAPAQCAELLPRSRRPWSLHPQVDGDLGRRMDATFRSMFRSRSERGVIIGTDCPMLAPHGLRTAFDELRTADVVIGPTLDGGYYLIGLRRRAVPELFREVQWSTEKVLETTLARITTLGLKASLLEPLRDVDTVDDLPALYTDLLACWHRRERPFPIHSFRFLQWELPPRTATKVRRPNSAIGA